jgi:hypothetical protein
MDPWERRMVPRLEGTSPPSRLSFSQTEKGVKRLVRSSRKLFSSSPDRITRSSGGFVKKIEREREEAYRTYVRDSRAS